MTLTGCAQYTSWVTLLIIMMVLLLILGAATVRAETRETVNFDFAWRHSLDKSEWRHPQAAVADAPSGAVATVDTADAALPPAAAPGFDDAAWEVVDTPHDMLITGPISYSLPADQGFRSRGAGWYRKCRPALISSSVSVGAALCLLAQAQAGAVSGVVGAGKHFALPADWKGSSVWVYIEGSFHITNAYFNGRYLGDHTAGYTSFWLRLDNRERARGQSANCGQSVGVSSQAICRCL